MTDSRNSILAIAATISVASSLSATAAARCNDAPVVAILAETRESGSKADSSRSGAKTAPGSVAPSPVNKATPASKSSWNQKDKGLQEP